MGSRQCTRRLGALTTLLRTDKTCAVDPGIAVLPERIDCAFDAQFRYACGGPAKD